METHNPGKFHFHGIYGCQVIYFQSFSYQGKRGFFAAFGLFLVDYNRKSSPTCTKLSPVMQCKAKYYIWYGFWYVVENSKKWSQRTNFLGFFQKFFSLALRRPMGDAQIFCQMKGIMKIHNRAKFHLYTSCDSQVKNLQKFSWQWSIHELGHFGVFLGRNSPKYDSILVKLATELVFKKRNTVLQEVLANSNLGKLHVFKKKLFFSVFA